MSVHVSILRHRWFLTISLLLVVGLLPVFVFGKPASGDPNLPTGFEQYSVANGLTRPTAMEFAPDGRLFVTEIGGTIRVINKEGTLLETPFVTIPDVDDQGGRGLLGVTFDPAFETGSPYVYVHYTQARSDGKPSHNRIVRFTANDDTAAEQDGIGLPIFELDDLGSSKKHNGGHIHFGNDGKLYIPVGDNKRDRFGPILNTMKLTNLFGKVLRINADGSIPTDNPFYDSTTGENQAIWARGLRNPFSFAVEPAPGNRIYINDVGEQRWEEINVGEAGANYGWPRHEGFEGGARFEKPIFAYKHDDLPRTPPATSGCAITGGAFYNPETVTFPDEYVGDYFFTDLCNGWIRRLEADSSKARGFATGANQPVDLKVSQDGSLYYLELGGELGGSVYEIRYTG